MDVLTLNFWVQHFQKIGQRKGKNVQLMGVLQAVNLIVLYT